jgi:hypothetical protein
LAVVPTMVRRLVDHVAAVGQQPDGLVTIPYVGPGCTRHIQRALQVIGPHPRRSTARASLMTITVLPCDPDQRRAHPRHLERLASVATQPCLRCRSAGTMAACCPSVCV